MCSSNTFLTCGNVVLWFCDSIVDSIVDLMNAIADTKESSLLHLCEFIEDCEFSELIVQVLHIVGVVGPATPSPSRFIRFVFNRVILENAVSDPCPLLTIIVVIEMMVFVLVLQVVRAAAVSTLGAFATKVPELRSSVLALLKRLGFLDSPL